MIHLPARSGMTLLLVCLSAADVDAQCKDWSHLFGPLGMGVDGDVHDMAVYDDGSGPRLYIAGEFVTAGGVPAAHVAAWNGSQWTALGGGLDGEAYALEVHGGSLYVGGIFSNAGGLPASRIARWNGASWNAVGQGFNAPVRALRSHDDGSGLKLFAGGQFTLADLAPADHIAVWNGAAWTQVGAGLAGTVNALHVYNEGSGPRLVAGGAFTTSGATSVKLIGRWNGASWSEIGGGIGGSGTPTVLSLEVFDDGSGAGPRLWVGGNFANAGGAPRANLAAWNGAVWSGPAQTPNGPVFALEGFVAAPLSILAVGGDFDGIAGALPVQHVAAWNGASWSALSTGLTPEINEPVCRDLRGFDDGSGPRLYAGGGFKAAGGKPSSRFGRWNDPCSSVTITAHPIDFTAVFAEPIVFEVEAHGTAPVTYQWRRNGVNLADSPGVEGTLTDTLTLFAWSYSDKGVYDVVITNPFGSVTSTAAVLTVPAGGLSGVPVQVTRVLHPPEVPDNSPADVFTAFYSPLQCPTDEIVFIAELNNGPQSLSSWSDGSTEILFRPGDAAPGLPAGFTLGSNTSGPEPFDQYVTGPNGAVAFQCDIQGPGVTPNDDQGIWRYDGTATQLVVREGAQAAGLPAGVVYRDLLPMRASDGGRVVFSGPTYSGAFFTTGVWTWEAGTGAALVARLGDPAPGTTTTFTSFLGAPQQITPGGDLLLQARLDTITGFNYSGVKDTGLWRGAAGALSLVARSGDPAPGMPAGSNLELFGTSEALSDDLGRVAFSCFVAGPSGFYEQGLFVSQGGTLAPVAVYGQQAPGAAVGSVFHSPRVLALGGPDLIVFSSGLETTCVPACATKGLWASVGGTIEPIVLGEPGWFPGTPEGFELSEVISAAADDDGNVIFECSMFGAGSVYRGVFGWSQSTGMYPIAVPGTQIEIEPDVYKMVENGFLPAVGGSAAVPYSRNLSSTGNVAFQANFSDGTQAAAQGELTLFKSLEFGAGTAYCFGDTSGTDCPCGNTSAPGSGCLNSSGNGAVLTATGSIQVAEDALKFTGHDFPGSTVALLMEGSGQAASGAGILFGDGLLCVGGSVVRLKAKVTSPDGTVQYDPPLAVSGGWDAGETWNFQVWYRDIPGPCGAGYNLSNGYRVTFVP